MNSDNTTQAPNACEPREGDGWLITAPTSGPHYPHADAHTWGAFAGVAVQTDSGPVAAAELGGYNDIELVNPYNGQRLWMSKAFRGKDGNIYDALRRLIDLAEREQFLG